MLVLMKKLLKVIEKRQGEKVSVSKYYVTKNYSQSIAASFLATFWNLWNPNSVEGIYFFYDFLP